jgi:dTDP-4-amino-4,6-dideoxygalactose transaminase
VPFAQLRRWRESGLIVIEDAAQAHLATDEDRFVGAEGDAACFSFYPGKNLGALGDGGMVLAREDAVLEEVRRLRDHGRTTKYTHDVVGWCSRLDGLQAAVLRVKLRHLRTWTDRRRALAARYRAAADGVRWVPWTDGAVHHLLVCRLDHRELVAERLSAAGIGTGIHYPEALSQQPWLVSSGARRAHHAELAAQQVLSLPMDPLMSDDEVDVVCEHLAGALVG